MKEQYTEHTDWCKTRDASVMWDEDTNVTRCGECGALTEEREIQMKMQMSPELLDRQGVSDGHTP